MTFAEEAEQELMRLMIQNRDSAFSKLEKSNQGESMVIKFLDHANQPTSPKQLADALNLSSARIAVVLGNLEKKGQIIRKIDQEDRRRINVTLTEAGKKVAKTQKKQMRDKVIQIFEQMGEKDTEQFIELIAQFVDYSQKLTLKEGDQ
ncbi:MarR family winged helix-turn-helix transcriptional regulator [Enterococcus sp. LJL99]